MQRHFLQALTLIFALGLSFCQAQTPDAMSAMRKINPQLPKPISFDRQRVAAAGIRILESEHLILLTDINGQPDIDVLPHVFDAAVPQWCDYFDVSLSRTEHWKLRGMIIADRKRFQNAGLIPADLPDFLAGFQRGHEMWVYLQPGNYYTRHLLLHEGTHSFMQWFLGGTGSPWFTEGMAELIGVHRWDGSNLKLNFQLTDRSQAEYWGRIKVIGEDRDEGRSQSLQQVFDFPPGVFREVRYYAWSWAACEFLSQHPLSQEAFAKMKGSSELSPEKFNGRVERFLSANREQLDRDWRLFISEIDFGYDVQRGSLREARSGETSGSFVVDASYSWQQTPVAVAAGQVLKITASGRFQVAETEGGSWPCEAGGVTIEYYQGRPLGHLMAGLMVDSAQGPRLEAVQSVGLARKIRFDRPGRLCLRINESPAALADNKGALDVSVTVDASN